MRINTVFSHEPLAIEALPAFANPQQTYTCMHTCIHTHTRAHSPRSRPRIRRDGPSAGDSQRRAVQQALDATVCPQLRRTIAQFPLIYSSALLSFNCEPSFPPLADVVPLGYRAKTALNRRLWCRFCLSPSTGGWWRGGGVGGGVSHLKRF